MTKNNNIVLNTGDDEKLFTYKSGSKCLTVLGFVDPIPPHLHIGSGTMFIFPHKKSGLVDRVSMLRVINVTFC